MDLEIRPATRADALTVVQVVLSAFAEYDGALQVRPSALSDTVEQAEHAIEQGGVLLAWDGGQAVGTVRYDLREDCLYVGRLAVAPSHRRRGVGAALMRYIEELAPTLGRNRIELATRQSMPGNLAFYGRLGYHVARTEPNKRGPDTNVWFAKEIASP